MRVNLTSGVFIIFRLLLLTLLRVYVLFQVEDRTKDMLDILKKLRADKRITQEQLGRAVGVSQQSINSYENTETQPDFVILVKIADYFNVTIDYLLGHDTHNELPEEIRKYSFGREEIELISEYLSLTYNQKKCINPMIDALKKPENYR